MNFADLAFFLSGDPSRVLSLAVRMLIIFSSAKVLAELCERFGQPGIIGEILAGVLIGPSVFGWIYPDEFTHTMAGLGVLFLLFRVGLEVDADELLKLGKTAVLVGVPGVVAPFAAGYLFYWLAGRGQLETLFPGYGPHSHERGDYRASSGGKQSAASHLGQDHIRRGRDRRHPGAVAAWLRQFHRIGSSRSSSGWPHYCVCSRVYRAIVARWGGVACGRLARWVEAQLQVGEAEFSMAMVSLFGLAALSETIGVASIMPGWPFRSRFRIGYMNSRTGWPNCWCRFFSRRSDCILI